MHQKKHRKKRAKEGRKERGKKGRGSKEGRKEGLAGGRKVGRQVGRNEAREARKQGSKEGRKEGCEIEMRCCKALPRCPAQRPFQLSKEDSLGKLHDICFLIVPSYIAGEALRPPPRPLPPLIVERFHFIHFIFSLTHSSVLPSFFHCHVHFM